jgi:hypothetical protein
MTGTLLDREKVGSYWAPANTNTPTLCVCLLFPLHCLQDLIGAIEGVFAGVAYLIDYLLWGVVALEVREHLVFSGGKVHVGQKLLELPEVEVAEVA